MNAYGININITYQLEEPFFEEKGRITAQKEIGDKTQMTFSSNGTFKGNIEVTNTGELVVSLKVISAKVKVLIEPRECCIRNRECFTELVLL